MNNYYRCCSFACFSYCFIIFLCCDTCFYLDVKLKILVHGVDVVKDVVCDARDDSHQLGVVQFSLTTTTDIDILIQD